eukprot:SAG31_NODE_844_length_11549_cov_2.985852_8_plen_356_part_00
MQEVPAGTGSGFVWDAEGHVVTNFHVIKEAINKGRAKVTLNRGVEAFDAKLVGADPEKDLAVLKVAAPASELSPIAVGSSADLLVGQSVVAIGNPFGLDHTLTTGVVSALGREVMGVGGRPITGCIQTDASINPGNSGGPLLDSSGRLIGVRCALRCNALLSLLTRIGVLCAQKVNTAIFSPSGAGSVGIGFSIPVDTVRRTVNQLIRYGRVQRPSLGVHIADDQMVKNLGRQLKMSSSELQGVLVITVGADSPASKAGMRGTVRDGRSGALVLGDIIIAVAGEPIRQVEELLSVVENRRVGEVVEVTVLRGVGASPERPRGAEKVLRVQLIERQQLPDAGRGQTQRVRGSRPRL